MRDNTGRKRHYIFMATFMKLGRRHTTALDVTRFHLPIISMNALMSPTACQHVNLQWVRQAQADRS
jgi:hypothetical protein